MPAAGVFPAHRRRPTPYLSPHDICPLLEARGADPAAAGRHHEALFGAARHHGMRIGEAISLHRHHVDVESGVITIRATKFDRSRLVPLHPTVIETLGHYASPRALPQAALGGVRPLRGSAPPSIAAAWMSQVHGLWRLLLVLPIWKPGTTEQDLLLPSKKPEAST